MHKFGGNAILKKNFQSAILELMLTNKDLWKISLLRMYALLIADD